MKGYRRYIALIALLFGALVLLEYFRPKAVDWSQTFSHKDKIPYGTYALYELLPGMFPEQPVQTVREPLYNQLQDSTLSGNYVLIQDYFAADSLDTNLLLDFVHRGNQAFIAAHQYNDFLQDTLHFGTAFLNSNSPDSTAFYFTSQPEQQEYTFPLNNNARYIQVRKQAGHEALGRNKAGKLNFMRVPFGKGHFYISSVPLAFTNYQLLTQNQSSYAATALSHLPVQPVLWDEYQNQGREEDQSVLRVLMRHEALTWAYYVGLASLLLFLLFKSKRTQRIIPVIEPPRNTTVDFVKAISSLYFNHGNHKNIAGKKIAYFLEHLRLRYHVSTHTLDEELHERIKTKSGADAQLIDQIFALIASIEKSPVISDQTLMMLNNYLEDFYRQTSMRPKAQV
ncbi:DUF4350 domain-containing protein [Pontibacter korlensis]|uniref:DUF4350 domain-containing protein n=1 Tax=Pontibacter korlensis TaxID=400092 RepID=A0A0E3ZI15_9BACT|nr:DUF4350 domain-containing protein [Pontibacter korlensis]AKD05090.1 hypothetical protein PKOR_20940 [Pontibacter korlensis]